MLILVNKERVRNISEINRFDGTLINLKTVGKFDRRYVVNRNSDVFLIKSETATKYKCVAIRPYTTRDGYIEYVLTTSKSRKKHIQAHRLVALLFLPVVRGKLYVNHKDGDRLNNKVGNLEWVTHQENVKHSFEKLGKVVWNKSTSN